MAKQEGAPTGRAVRAIRRLAGWLAIVVLLAAPILSAWWVIDRAESSVEAPSPLVWVPAMSAGDVATEPTVIVPTWEQGLPVVAPAWSGLVQQILTSPGAVLVNGSPVALVDGVVRIAAQTPVPISRPLQRGDRGPDVAALNGLLTSLDLSPSPDDTFGSSTAAGVSDLAEQLGAGGVEVFDPAWVLYLPAAGRVVESVALTVAQPVPAAGDVVVTVQPDLTGARVVPPDAVSDAPAAVSDAESAAGASPESPTPGRPDATLQIDPSEFYRDLEAGTVVTAADTDLGSVSPDGVLSPEALSALLGFLESGQDRLQAVLRQPLPPETTHVPAATVISDLTGATCVVARTDDGTATTVAVEVIDSYIGVSTVAGIVAGTDVLVNAPAESRQSCQSS